MVEKFKDYNIFIGNIIRAPKVKKVSKGEEIFLLPIMIVTIYLIMFKRIITGILNDKTLS